MSHIRTSTAIFIALCALALAGCDDPPPPDTRPRAESAGGIVMPDGSDAHVVVLPTGERILVLTKHFDDGHGRKQSIAAVLLPPVAAEGKGVGP